jgi:phosphoglycerate dehydrogenase-like enzyme
MKKKTVKWGIIGLGKIAKKFATDLATLENTALLQ